MLAVGNAARLARRRHDEDGRRPRGGAERGRRARRWSRRSRSSGTASSPPRSSRAAPPASSRSSRTSARRARRAPLPARARASSSRAAGDDPDERPRDHDRRPGRRSGTRSPARTVYVEFSDGDRVPARIVGYDLFDDVGLIKVDPARHAARPVPLGDSSAGRRRRAGRGDRQPVRQRRLALGRRRLGDPALDPVAHHAATTCRRDPDRRADQPRQLGRPALRRARPRDRDQRPDPLERHRLGLRGRRLRRADRLRAPLAAAARCRRATSATPSSGSRRRT